HARRITCIVSRGRARRPNRSVTRLPEGRDLRIAVLNWSRRRVGGVEIYLGAVIPELAQAGHQVGFWYEMDRPQQMQPIPLHAASAVWSVELLGAARAVADLQGWQPDVLYSHGLLSPTLESETLAIAPTVFFAHGYYGTCISGARTVKNPVIKPCERRFGPACLLH